MDNLLSGLISSKTRVKLLMRFFLNPQARSYLRELAKEFSVSTNAVREELIQLTSTNLLKAEKFGRQVFYSANPDHPLFPELQSMVLKVTGVDQVIDSIIARLGSINAAYLLGDYATGIDSGIIDLLLIGDIDRHQLNDLVAKTEKYIKRKIRVLALSENELSSLRPEVDKHPKMLIWSSEIEKASI